MTDPVLGDSEAGPRLGVRATVAFHDEGGEPKQIEAGEGLRTITVFPGRSEKSFSELGYQALKKGNAPDTVLPMDSSNMLETLVQEIEVISSYTLHVALYALQNPTPENIAKALRKIGTSGDCEEWWDHETMLPQPVPEPPSWERDY